MLKLPGRFAVSAHAPNARPAPIARTPGIEGQCRSAALQGTTIAASSANCDATRA